MPKRKWELEGRRFDRLVVLVEAQAGLKNRRWRCRCDCGNEVTYHQSTLLLGKAKSCGCANITLARARINSAYPAEWRIWRAMLERCLYETHKSFANYGGRGITVCDRWREFANFIADVGPRPTPKHQIDRYPDNDGNYEPSNCRWATATEQQNNRRSNRRITINGQTKTVYEWSLLSGVSGKIIRSRLYSGKTPAQAIAGWDGK